MTFGGDDVWVGEDGESEKRVSDGVSEKVTVRGIAMVGIFAKKKGNSTTTIDAQISSPSLM